MRRDRRLRPPSSPHRPQGAELELPSLIELERFTQASLHQWLAQKSSLSGLQRALYFGLEPHRQSQEPSLLDALRSRALHSHQFEGWSRIIDYRYGCEPLSVAGSLKGDGGRFNIGGELSPGAFTAFPALYIAEDYDAAFRERFGQSSLTSEGLSSQDLALRLPASFTHVRLRGVIENVIDVGDLESLRPIANILREFSMPRAIPQTARRLGLRQSPWLVRSPVTLQRQLVTPNWRMLPMQFDLPSNSQIFGRLAVAAGLHGVLYPSARHQGKRCAALFPQNWATSGSFVEVVDAAPEAARLTRIDGMTRSLA